ncbi:MAG TPA: LuxR C-terminal-related transcriptional regulator [Acidimicrobiia bacterium]|nr:LuxR C-terminal-related transcriptional regulator [Acidimicrobiia bacterium]
MQEGPTGSLLETKLNVPRRPRGLVDRSRLIDRIDLGTEAKLILISAPAGSGKTTLLSAWAAGRRDEADLAWYSVDPADNEPVTFWTHVMAALGDAVPGVGQSSLALLHDAQVSDEGVITALVNELSDAGSEVWLVLDDLHVIDTPAIRSGLAFLLEHLSSNVHLVIATRADPALPLARLRARGELIEIRVADLRFTFEEALAYFNEQMSLSLTANDVGMLEEKTEGWIAALQLAALSIRGRDDPSEFIAGFAGSQRYIVDYLVEEVLARQDSQVRAFLMETSILSRMSGPLCDALTTRGGGQAMLESLERSNLFIVPLDEHRRWFRYHHLFGDVLRSHLLAEQSDLVPKLHRRASHWYETHGDDRTAAIQHALDGGDAERAAELVELSIPALRRGRKEATLRQWLEALPAELVATRPILGLGYVGALLAVGNVEGVERLLDDAEHALNQPSPDGGSANVDELARLPAGISLYRAALRRMAGDDPNTIIHATRAVELSVDDDHLVRGGATGFLALAHWTRGALDEAFNDWAAAMAHLEQAGHIADAIGCAISMADIRIAQGRLSEAFDIYRRGRAMASPAGEPPLRGAADMHVGMCEIHRERHDIAAARKDLATALELGEENGLPQHRFRIRLAEARILQSEGDLEGAIEMWRDAEPWFFTDFSPDVRPFAVSMAKLNVLTGRVSDAVAWSQRSGLTVTDELSYVHEFEHVTFARVLLAQATDTRSAMDMDAITDFIDRLLRAATAGGRGRSIIEILILQALAAEAAGDRLGAVRSLEQALALAEPEGHVAVFLDERAALDALLRRVDSPRSTSEQARRMPAALRPEGAGRPRQPLVVPLTDRELEVLRLLESDASGPDIARRLYVSLNTLRTHTKSIYSKLGVDSRRAAVRRGAELGLLSQAPTGR